MMLCAVVNEHSRLPRCIANMEVMLTWCVNDCKIWTKLVFNLDNNLLGPKLLFSLQTRILTLYVVLQMYCKRACMTGLL